MADTTESLQARVKDLEAKAQAARRKLCELEREIQKCESQLYTARQRERVEKLVGQEVRHSHIVNNAKLAWLNDVTGRLVKINRKYAIVDFGEGRGEWRVPIRHIYAADDQWVGAEIFI